MYEFPPKTHLGNFSFTIEALTILYFNYIYSVAMATLSGQDLHCGICSNVFTNPLMMPCLHSFCKKCLEQQLEDRSIVHLQMCYLHYLVEVWLVSLHWLAHQAEVSGTANIEDANSIAVDGY